MIKKEKIILCLIMFFSVFFVLCIGDSLVIKENREESLSEATRSAGGTDPFDKTVTGLSLENNRAEPSFTGAQSDEDKKNMPDEIRAFYRAYSHFINEIKFTNDDWLISLRGVDLFWAEGKLLPRDKKQEQAKYRPYGFYNYADDLPEIIKEADAQMLERFKRYTESRKNQQRDNTFLETLYNGQNLKEIQKNIKTINFLGFRIEVHESIINRYNAIDKEIKEAALKNPEIKQFLSSLGAASAFMWRDIENSKSKSYHSFGIAIDISPAKLGNKQIYWNWTANYNDKWYAVPYSKRWMPPMEVIKIFEKYGFIWGGKWLMFDNMHFEYRPEILILSGKEVMGL